MTNTPVTLDEASPKVRAAMLRSAASSDDNPRIREIRKELAAKVARDLSELDPSELRAITEHAKLGSSPFWDIAEAL